MIKKLHTLLSSNTFNFNKDIYSSSFKYFNEKLFIKRTVDDLGNIFLFQPRKRVSFDRENIRENFHTIWLSNNPKWAQYPKRDHAIIMSLHESNSIFYGDNLYNMLIPNNTKVAICEKNDLVNNFGIYNTYILNSILNTIFENNIENYKYYDNMSYDQLLHYINEIDKNITSARNVSLDFYDNNDTQSEFYIAEYLLKKSLMKTLSEYYDTSKVKLLTVEEIINDNNYHNKYDNNELWVDVPCLGINEEFEEQFLKDNK